MFSYRLLFLFVISWLLLSSFGIITSLTGFSSAEIGGIRPLMLAISNLNYIANPAVHMNIIRAAQRTVGPGKWTNEDQQHEKPVACGTEEKYEFCEM